jgi:hypothetical protein
MNESKAIFVDSELLNESEKVYESQHLMRSEMMLQTERFSGTENAFEVSELFDQTQFITFSNYLEDKEELFPNERSEMFSVLSKQYTRSICIRSMIGHSVDSIELSALAGKGESGSVSAGNINNSRPFNSDDDDFLSSLSTFSGYWRTENKNESRTFSKVNEISKQSLLLNSSLLTEDSNISAESLLWSNDIFVSGRKSVSDSDSEGNFDDKEVVIERFVSFVWIVCIAILFVTGSFFFGWSIYSEMHLINVKEDTTSS